ncbi:hypothetical protein QFC22_004460 [Naganishia vaughanmartiniae]|uniref:Uncharacterized protein n=1 Tax=Naganishia vaughanmartiniae TaxID=1424756 RepID=A0ACC2X0M5_9TREE|nr:hypothetical protein QFC22_004460 [Naganishia vaughanmartiniae]
MSSSSATAVQPASAIPPELLLDLSESPTAGADIHEVEQSPDTMFDGAFPSRSGNADGFGLAREGRVHEARLMPTETREGVAEVVSPFLLQGPIKLDPVPSSSDTSTTTASTAPFDPSLDTPVAPNAAPAGSTPTRFPSVRKAPDSPSQSPSVSRRTSSQEVPSSISQQQHQSTLSPAETAPTVAEDTIEYRTSNIALTDPGSTLGNGNGHAVPTNGGVLSGRTRRPSTLIPQPGREGETVPPRYRTEESAMTAVETGQGETGRNGELKEGDEKVLDTSTTTKTDTPNETAKTAGQDDTTTTTTAASDINTSDNGEIRTTTPPVREPRVVVRDFGFASHDPRYRGAFHPIPGEAEENASDEEDEDDARSTASGASSGWNRFTSGGGRVRRKSSLGAGAGGWSGFGFGGFGAAVVRRFSKSSGSGSGSGRRGSLAGLSTAGSNSAGDAQQENGAGSRRGSTAQAGTSAKSPGPIVLPTPLPRDTDTDVLTSLSDLTPTPSSIADDDDVAVRVEGNGTGGGYAFGSGSTAGGIAQGGEDGARLSILSQVSEEGGFPQSDSSASDDEGSSNRWPESSATGNTNNSTSTSGTGTTVTAREPRGRYKVLYEFEAEGDHEMSVREGEVLMVGGRWGSMGWVIAERVEGAAGEGQRKGLVPEGYLGERID